MIFFMIFSITRHGRVDVGKAVVEPVNATDDGRFTHKHRGDAVVGRRHQLGGQVAGTQVFSKRGANVGSDFNVQVKGKINTLIHHDVDVSD